MTCILKVGFELHVGVDDVAPLWQRIWQHPAASALELAPFGSQASCSVIGAGLVVHVE